MGVYQCSVIWTDPGDKEEAPVSVTQESPESPTEAEMKTRLAKLAREYGFRDVTALRRENFPHQGQDNNLFIAEMKLTGLKHWWHGGGTGMSITAKALVYDMRELLEMSGFKIIRTDQHYIS